MTYTILLPIEVDINPIPNKDVDIEVKETALEAIAKTGHTSGSDTINVQGTQYEISWDN